VLSYGHGKHDIIADLILQFKDMTDPNVRMWIVNEATALKGQLILSELVEHILPDDPPVLKQKIVRKIIELTNKEIADDEEVGTTRSGYFNGGAILRISDIYDSLDPESRREFDTFVDINFPMLRRMRASNKGNWQYPALN